MEQKTKYLYELEAGELVRVQVVPVGVTQALIHAVLDGVPLQHSQSGNLDFEFVFSGKDSSLLIHGEFVDPQPGSRYDLFLSSSNEEKKPGPTLDPKKKVVEITFRTRTGPPK